MKKNEISNGLSGLLQTVNQPTNPEPTKTIKTQPVSKPEPAPTKVKGNYKTVCYSIPPELDEKIKYIAYYDRKKINAVVADAFEKYIRNWKPSANEEPKKL